MFSTEILFWIIFNIFVLLMLILDLFVFNQKSHEIKFKEALYWSFFWILLAFLFNGFIYFYFGKVSAIHFLTGYVIEKSLSVDNLFVFYLIFNFFKTPKQFQHKLLFWGIIGALFFRILFIVAGIGLLQKFHFLFYIFGFILIVSGIKLLFENKKEIHPEQNFFLKFIQKVLPVNKDQESGKFFIKIDKKWYVTPLFLTLLYIELTDIVFAIDSIPAILAITTDSFIVYTSNVFAILGLRSLYFALVSVIQRFHYLHYGLGIILAFIGIKMMIMDIVHIPILLSLSIILSILIISITLSFLFSSKVNKPQTE